MPVTTSIDHGALVVHLRGADALWSLARDVIVPLESIRDVRVVDWAEVRAGLGWRVGGTYIPGRIATGHYLVQGEDGARQFLAVFGRPGRLVLVETALAPRRRVVVQVPDPDRLAAEIRAAAGLPPHPQAP